jgi:DNA mismatch repair protein MutS2
MKEPDGANDEEDFPAYYIVTDVLDLHGFFPEQVPEMIAAFIENARELGLKRLRIIHGKGKSKLKYIVRKELERNPHVAEFGDAPPEIGGWGATIVILK